MRVLPAITVVSLLLTAPLINSFSDGEFVVARIRVSAEFPTEIGEVTSGRVFFATRRLPSGAASSAINCFGELISETSGDPPLILEGCEVTLRVFDPDIAEFTRCEANGDGKLDIVDPIFVLDHLFTGGRAPECDPAADCNADGVIDMTDPILSLV